MKSVMESVLDEFDVTERRVTNKAAMIQLEKLFDNADYDSDEYKDMFGRKIMVGDIVLGIEGSFLDVYVVDELFTSLDNSCFRTKRSGNKKYCNECILIPQDKIKDFIKVLS